MRDGATLPPNVNERTPPADDAPPVFRRVLLAVLLAAALASLLPFVALAPYAFPSADDYCLAIQTKDGFWQMQARHYLTWTGRYSATFLQTLASHWDLTGLYPWTTTATLAATFVSFWVSIATFAARPLRRFSMIVAAAVSTAVFVGGLPSKVEAFYWMASATTYQWGLIVYLLWLTLLARITGLAVGRADGMGWRAAAAILTVLLPGFNEVTIPMVFATLAGFMLAGWRAGKVDRFLVVLLGLAIASATLSVLAPGNLERSRSYPALATRHDVEFALAETMRQTVRFARNHVSDADLWAAAFAAWWLGRGVMASLVARLGGLRSGWLCLALLLAAVYLTLFPVYWEYGAINHTGEGRTYNVTYFAFWLSTVWAVGLSMSTVARQCGHAPVRPSRIAELVVTACLAALMIASPATARAYRALEIAPAYLQEQQAREAQLRTAAARGEPALVHAIDNQPDGLFWGDIEPDPSHWINACVATYYGLTSVQSHPDGD